MDGAVRAVLWCVTIILHGPTMLCSGLPMLNDEDIRIKNLTDTSVVLAWRPIEISDLSQYRLMVAYKRQGYNTRYMEAVDFDPECSLRLSYCRLTALLPDTLYSVVISIDHRGNNTLLGRADLFFSTMPQSNDKDLQWWLMFVVGPVVGGLVLLIIIIIILAKCCGWCCWRKRGPIHHPTSSFSSSSSSTRHVMRSESHATREWVQDTFRTVQPDPPSTYDRPCVHSPTVSPSQRDPHSYLQMYQLSVPRSAPPASPRSPDSCQSCLPFPGRQKTWQKEDQAGQGEQAAQTQRPTNYLNVSSDTGENAQTTHRHNQGTEFQLPNRQYPPLQPPRKGKQDQVIYANTEDVNKLLGSAKKMFPML